MKYLPFESISYESGLDPDEVLQRLDRVTYPKEALTVSSLFKGVDNKEYFGSVEDGFFKVNRIIKGQNSFQPIIKGYVKENGSGSSINIKMRPAIFPLVFMSIWLTGFGFGAICGILSFFFVSQDLVRLLPVVILVGFYILMLQGFKIESLKSKQYFAQLFEAEAK